MDSLSIARDRLSIARDTESTGRDRESIARDRESTGPATVTVALVTEVGRWKRPFGDGTPHA